MNYGDKMKMAETAAALMDCVHQRDGRYKLFYRCLRHDGGMVAVWTFVAELAIVATENGLERMWAEEEHNFIDCVNHAIDFVAECFEKKCTPPPEKIWLEARIRDRNQCNESLIRSGMAPMPEIES